MKKLKDWIYRSKLVLKLTAKNASKILGTVFVILGMLLTVSECIQRMFGSDIIYSWMHTYPVPILIGSCIISFQRNRVKLSTEYFLEGTDIKIRLQVCDVLDTDGAIVIPTNTTFDTRMEDEFISIQSVQGQFQKRYFENNLGELDEQLGERLNGRTYNELGRVNSKNKRYLIGTVSTVTVNNQHYHFVAIADINEVGKTINTKVENIPTALEGIWSHIKTQGHIEDIAIPLIGTGKAGIAGVSRETVIRDIVHSFIAISKDVEVTERLSVCIHPLDLESKQIDLMKLDEWLRYSCKYWRFNETRRRS